MKKTASGVISFLRYEVERVNFQINSSYMKEEVELEFEPEATFHVSGEDMLVTLTLHIFKNAKENDYPFEMDLVINGYFSLDIEVGKIEDFQANALAILYPYARSLVSSFTANANVTPLILPTININKMLSDSDN